jgi:uncharacterized protein YecE (DUF72 family)/ubiquinone/menaquinone biosynthesis C-methylase UbiE
VLDPEVRAYYEEFRERDRLTRGGGRVEWVRTWELLDRFLPPPPATVLDVGGGPGAYAVPLALAGHAVHLVDAMPLHVEQATQAATAACVQLASATVGDARALAAADAGADAVLLLGPLYHLLEAGERAAALAEARRVLRPGGVLLAVGISRFASLYDGLRGGWAADEPHVVESGLRTGTHRNPAATVGRFTTAHFARPEELAAEVTTAGFAEVTLLAVEGPAAVLADPDPWLDDPRRRAWLLRALRRVEAERPCSAPARTSWRSPAPPPEPADHRRQVTGVREPGRKIGMPEPWPPSPYRIGISGWTYAPWRRVFYPEGLAHRRELEYASRRLNSIEINGSFYSLQRPESYRRWREATPPGFLFSVKGPRFVTHMKKLANVDEPVANFFASGVLALGEKLGPVLWQLPPSLGFDPERLAAFFTLLPRTTGAAAALAERHDSRLDGRAYTTAEVDRPLRHALEVRHRSFETPAFAELLRAYDVALVTADTAGKWPMLDDVTSDFVYVRLHGAEELYVSGYDPPAIASWAAKIRTWATGGTPAGGRTLLPPAPPRPREVHVYFDNDVKVRAPFDAIALAAELGVPQPGGPPLSSAPAAGIPSPRATTR